MSNDVSTLEFGDFVAQGRQLVQQRDTNAWALGDLCVHFEVVLGRPSDPEAPTLSDLAREWNVETPRLSEWRSVANFYPEYLRTFEDLSWGHYNLARRASDGVQDNALELLATAQHLHLGIRAFKRYIDGTYFEGEIESKELPEWLRVCLPSGARTFWIVVKNKKAEC